MSDPSFFAGLLCTTLHSLFKILISMLLSQSNLVPRALSTTDDSFVSSSALTSVMANRFSGATILALMNVCMKLEQHGLTEIYQALTLMLSVDGSSSHIYQQQELAPSGLWIPGMDTELSADMQDEMAKVARAMRKRYCEYYTQ